MSGVIYDPDVTDFTELSAVSKIWPREVDFLFNSLKDTSVLTKSVSRFYVESFIHLRKSDKIIKIYKKDILFFFMRRIKIVDNH